MTLPSADTSSLPDELGGGAELCAGDGLGAGLAECVTLAAGVLARAVGEWLTGGVECAWSALRSKSVFIAVPPSC